MIIGGNKNNINQGQSFAEKMKNNSMNNNKSIKPNTKKDFGFKETINDYNHANPANDMAMYDKSLAMLKNRLDNGLISIDEFNKKCEQIGKKRAASMNNKPKF